MHNFFFLLARFTHHHSDVTDIYIYVQIGAPIISVPKLLGKAFSVLKYEDLDGTGSWRAEAKKEKMLT